MRKGYSCRWQESQDVQTRKLALNDQPLLVTIGSFTASRNKQKSCPSNKEHNRTKMWKKSRLAQWNETNRHTHDHSKLSSFIFQDHFKDKSLSRRGKGKWRNQDTVIIRKTNFHQSLLPPPLHLPSPVLRLHYRESLAAEAEGARVYMGWGWCT